jgi:hypothetical protein
MTDDGRSAFVNAHQSSNLVRGIVFDANGTRIAAVSLPTNSGDCDGGNTARMLALDEAHGDFTVVCARSGDRAYRRFRADGTALDPAAVIIAGSRISGFAFSNFGAARNDTGTTLYFGATTTESALVRAYDQNGTIAGTNTLAGNFSGAMYHMRATSTGVCAWDQRRSAGRTRCPRPQHGPVRD